MITLRLGRQNWLRHTSGPGIVRISTEFPTGRSFALPGKFFSAFSYVLLIHCPDIISECRKPGPGPADTMPGRTYDVEYRLQSTAIKYIPRRGLGIIVLSSLSLSSLPPSI